MGRLIEMPIAVEVTSAPEPPKMPQPVTVPAPVAAKSLDQEKPEPEERARAVMAAVPEVPKVPDVLEVPKALDVPTVPALPEVAQLRDAPKTPDVQEIPKVLDMPNVPEVTEVRAPETLAAPPAPSLADVAAPVAAGPPPRVAVAKEPPLDNVVPLSRAMRVEAPPPATTTERTVDRLLTLASTRGASLLYLTSQSRPFLRVEGAMQAVDGEPPLTSADIDLILLDLMSEAAREAQARGEPAEWEADFDGIGRTRCAAFRDHRGPGVLFQLVSTRPISAEQLGLAREIQALATESEGLVVVAGPRGGGKSTIVAALVDLINRQQSGSVITIERQIRSVHDNRLSLVSQREVRGTGAAAAAVVRAALRENPDVLVLDDVSSPDVLPLALEAAGSGVLVFLTIAAGSTVSALMRMVDAFPPEARKGVQTALAERLRGVVSQVVLRKTGGGRLAARELLLTSSSIASLIADGQFAQLAVAIESGRKHGMVSLNDVLVSLVKSGTVAMSEAYRKSDNCAALLTLLKRDGVDTSPVERLA
jgi:twitching motility protein PilT